MHGVDEGHPTENVPVPERNTMVCSDEIGVKTAKKQARLDIVRTEEHLIGKNEIGEDNKHQREEI
jgi:hypothetical protein